MRTSWKIHDLIDLEYFFHRDQEVNETLLDQRDREIFIRKNLSFPTGDPKEQQQGYRSLIHKWLDVRRTQEKALNPELVLPGQAYRDVFRTLAVLLVLIGGVIGITMAVGFLRYSGTQAINVFYYLGLLVFTQLILAVAVLVMLGTKMLRALPLSVSPLYRAMGLLLARGINRITRPVEHKISASGKQNIQGAENLIRLKSKVYGKLFFWPIFILFQLFGVALNLGVLFGTMARVLGTDLAFGWQTTLDLAPEAVYNLTRIMALPWKWFIPQFLAHPSLEEIIGSRIILKEGIQTLATQDLVSWWPFLCFSVIFYGLIPRILFLGWGVLSQKHLLNKLPLSHGDCRQLVSRMTTPLVASSGASAGHEVLPVKTDQEPETGGLSVQLAENSSLSQIVLIPEDIYDDIQKKLLADHFRKYLDEKKMSCHKIAMDMDSDASVLNPLLETTVSSAEHVFILLEAWQPPIKETLMYLKELRNRIGERMAMVIGLVGRPKQADILSKVKDEDFVVWQKQIATLTDPFLILTKVNTHV